MEYVNVHLPDYFITLLKSNMASRVNFISEVTNYIMHYPAFLGLIKKYFRDVDEQIRLDVILKSMGWENFRNKMALIYINFENKGMYLNDLDSSYLSNLLALERQVSSFITSDNSRAFLLSFYKTLGTIKLERLPEKKNYVLPELNHRTTALLEYANSKIKKVDVVLIILEQLIHLLGYEPVKKILSEKYPFSAIYGQMDDRIKEAFIKNLLIYGQSVNEVDLFVKDTI